MTLEKLAGRHIVITRPEAQAGQLCRRIAEQGGTAHAFPLIEIVPLRDFTAFDTALATLDDYDWAIFISSNAVENGLPRLKARQGGVPSRLRFAAIGPVTAAGLAEHGITQTLTPALRFDSEALLALPEMQAVAGRKIMIFRGVGGRELLADTLRARGAEVRFAECYRRINPQANADSLDRLWQNKTLDAIVVTSTEAMRHLLDLAGTGSAWLAATPICVNHARIAELARRHGMKAEVAEAPGDDAMLACLIQTLNRPQGSTKNHA